MKPKIKLGIFIFSLFFGTNILAQNKMKEFDRFFSALAVNQDFNGNVLVAEKGKIVYEKSFGYADFPGKKLNTKNTLFPIASISKRLRQRRFCNK